MSTRLSLNSHAGTGAKIFDTLDVTIQALVVLALGTASVQGSVIYSFLGTGTFGTSVTTGMSITTVPEPVAFQLTTPSFLNPRSCDPIMCDPVPFSCGQLDSSTNCLVQGDSPSVGFFYRYYDTILFSASNNVEYAFNFPIGALGAPGVYSSNFVNAGTLTVAVTAVPEPTAVLLVLGGICLVFVFSPLQTHTSPPNWSGRCGPFPANSSVVPHCEATALSTNLPFQSVFLNGPVEPPLYIINVFSSTHSIR
jgi:hypothetical protein